LLVISFVKYINAPLNRDVPLFKSVYVLLLPALSGQGRVNIFICQVSPMNLPICLHACGVFYLQVLKTLWVIGISYNSYCKQRYTVEACLYIEILL